MGQSRNNDLSLSASSTLSSQLGNILGQLSENWNISPNFRSEKGDFSDMEVELALSSQLLNNRLIFNGNFGIETTRSITIHSSENFDLEYLLNKSGTIRLKAYNHYNDRNYYIKSALTTQGVGSCCVTNFNRWGDLFRKNPKNNGKTKDIQSDSIPRNTILPNDTISTKSSLSKEKIPQTDQ